MKKLMFTELGLFFSAWLSACTPAMTDRPPSTSTAGQLGRRALVQSGDTIYETMPGSTIPDYTRPVRKLQPGETFVPDNPGAGVATPTPHAQTLEEGEALENKMAREAEEKTKTNQDPSNQVKAEQENIDHQIQAEQEKAEGNN
jgi:hypothetical protein